MNLPELSQTIRKVRLAQGMTVDQLAQKSGFSKGFISQVENFRITPSLKALIRIAEALGIPMSKLFDETGRMPNTHSVHSTAARKFNGTTIRNTGYGTLRWRIGRSGGKWTRLCSNTRPRHHANSCSTIRRSFLSSSKGKSSSISMTIRTSAQ